nr:MAG TPA: hypothetical protein [Bacteriophage sp.]
MEQIKYIPGDLVYIPTFGKYYTIISCGTYPYEARDENDNDAIIEEDDIVPIPITPEILDNNKWKRLKSKRYTWWRARFDGVYYFIKPNKDYPSVWELCRGKTKHRFKKIRYVHQLQYFLFGLDLNSDMRL